MTLDGFLRLAVQTISAPRDVARLLLSLRLPREALWLMFALVIVGNGLIFAAGLVIRPPSSQLGVLQVPIVFMVLQAAVLGLTISMITTVGRFFGGTAQIEGIALLLIWVQALRLLLQLVLTLLYPLMPGLGDIVVFAAWAIGVYILTSFIDEAHGLNSMGKSVLVLIAGGVAVALILSVLLTLAGFDPNGMPNNV